MGNTRRFNPSRRQRVLSLKERNKQLAQEAGYYQGLVMAQAAQLEAMHMERPEGLDEWIDTILGDLDEQELAEWESMTPAEREMFVDQLGQRIKTQEALLSTTAAPTETPD